jgi:hypothetical protein
MGSGAASHRKLFTCTPHRTENGNKKMEHSNSGTAAFHTSQLQCSRHKNKLQTQKVKKDTAQKYE